MGDEYLLTTKKYINMVDIGAMLSDEYSQNGLAYIISDFDGTDQESRKITVSEVKSQDYERDNWRIDTLVAFFYNPLWIIRYTEKQQKTGIITKLRGGYTISIETVSADEERTKKAIEEISERIGLHKGDRYTK